MADSKKSTPTPSTRAKPAEAAPRSKSAKVVQAAEPRAAKPGNAGSKPAPRSKPTRPDVKVFIAEYLRDSNGRRAAIAAGYSAKTADQQASRLLKTVKVRAEVDRHESEIVRQVQADTGITKAKALQEAWSIVTADANDLIQYRRLACDECHGGCLNRADRMRDPDPQCKQCAGEGLGSVYVHDTRLLSPQARALYAGVKVTKEGLEVKMHSKLDALEKVFKHLGLYKEDNDQKNAGVEALRKFFKHLHGGAGRLPVVHRDGRPSGLSSAPADA